MKNIVDSNGNEIGVFNGISIKDINGNIIYWVCDDEVFAPTSYSESSLSLFNKGQSSLIGSYIDDQCVAAGEVIFTVRN